MALKDKDFIDELLLKLKLIPKITNDGKHYQFRSDVITEKLDIWPTTNRCCFTIDGKQKYFTGIGKVIYYATRFAHLIERKKADLEAAKEESSDVLS